MAPPRLTRDELLEALKELKVIPYEPVRTDNGPINNPTNTYLQVPEPTRKWLEGLRPGDIQELENVRIWYRDYQIVKGWGKWLVVALVGLLLYTGQVATAIKTVISSFSRPS